MAIASTLRSYAQIRVPFAHPQNRLPSFTHAASSTHPPHMALSVHTPSCTNACSVSIRVVAIFSRENVGHWMAAPAGLQDRQIAPAASDSEPGARRSFMQVLDTARASAAPTRT